MNNAPGTATAANGVVGHLTLFVAFVLCHEMTDALKKKNQKTTKEEVREFHYEGWDLCFTRPLQLVFS